MAFIVLWLIPDGYGTVMVISLGFASARRGPARPAWCPAPPVAAALRDDRPPSRSTTTRFRLAGRRHASLRPCWSSPGCSGLLTIGDGFIYLALLDSGGFATHWFPRPVRRDERRLPRARDTDRPAQRPGRAAPGPRPRPPRAGRCVRLRRGAVLRRRHGDPALWSCSAPSTRPRMGSCRPSPPPGAQHRAGQRHRLGPDRGRRGSDGRGGGVRRAVVRDRPAARDDRGGRGGRGRRPAGSRRSTEARAFDGRGMTAPRAERPPSRPSSWSSSAGRPATRSASCTTPRGCGTRSPQWPAWRRPQCRPTTSSCSGTPAWTTSTAWSRRPAGRPRGCPGGHRRCVRPGLRRRLRAASCLRTERGVVTTSSRASSTPPGRPCPLAARRAPEPDPHLPRRLAGGDHGVRDRPLLHDRRLLDRHRDPQPGRHVLRQPREVHPRPRRRARRPGRPQHLGRHLRRRRPHLLRHRRTGGKTYLVEGDLEDRTLTTVADGVECPSLSPDGTRIAFKQAGTVDGPDRAGRRPSSTSRPASAPCSPASRNVDDQIEWLDDDTILYGLPARRRARRHRRVVARHQRGRRAELFIEQAWSPTVVH